MKQKASKSPKLSSNLNPELQTLLARSEKAEKAAEKAYTDFEKKHAAYKEALESGPAKGIFIQVTLEMKIARFTYKLKRAQYKLAKRKYKSAKKTAQKPDKPVAKETPAAKAKSAKPKAKKTADANAA